MVKNCSVAQILFTDSRNGLSVRHLDTIAEERTLSDQELVAGLRSFFDNVCKLELMLDKNGKNTLGGL